MSGRTQSLLDSHVPMSIVVEDSINDDLEDMLGMDVMDSNILESESSGPIADVGVKVTRFVFGAAFGQSLIIIALSFLVFTLSAKIPIHDKKVALIVMWIITAVTLLLLTALRKSNKVAVGFLVVLTFELSLLVGFISIILGNIAPIQFMAILFGQTTAIFGYTFISPRYIDLRKAMVATIVATIIVWCLGIFAFYQDKDWPTSIFILITSFVVSIYYALQIKHVDRYNIGERVLAFVGLFVDPILTFFDLIKKCFTCCHRKKPPSPFEEDEVVL